MNEKKGNGAVTGGWICLGLALALILIPFPFFYVYLPLLLVAFVLGIVALAQNRTGSGLGILFGVIGGAPIAWVISWGILAGFYSAALAKRDAQVQAALASRPVVSNEVEEAKAEKLEVTPWESSPAYLAQRVAEQKQREAEAAAAAEKVRLKKEKDAANLLSFHQGLADQGDAYGLYKMGMRYLAGEGVAKDPQKARELLAGAAAKGQVDAREELAKLPPQTVDK